MTSYLALLRQENEKICANPEPHKLQKDFTQFVQSTTNAKKVDFSEDTRHSKIVARPWGKGWSIETETSPATASLSCKTCAYVTGRGGCGNSVEAGLSDVAGVIRYHADDGKGCTAHKPSTVPTGNPTDCFDALPIPSHQTGRKNTPQSTLEGRIYAMAKRWNYSGDELALVLEGAKADPVGWARMCELDERECE